MTRRCVRCGRPGVPLYLCWRCAEHHAIAGYLRLTIPGSTGWSPANCAPPVDTPIPTALSTSSPQAPRRPMEP